MLLIYENDNVIAYAGSRGFESIEPELTEQLPEGQNYFHITDSHQLIKVWEWIDNRLELKVNLSGDKPKVYTTGNVLPVLEPEPQPPTTEERLKAVEDALLALL